MQLYELSESELTIDRVRSLLPDWYPESNSVMVQEMVAAVRARSERAETRAAVVLGAAGILSGLVVSSVGHLRAPGIEGWLVLGGLFIATLVLLFKAVLFGLSALDSLRGFELSPEAGIEISGMTEQDAERTELVARVWEYYQLLFVSNSRLYYSQRSQNNFALAIISWALTALGTFILSVDGIKLPAGWEIGVALAAVVVALTADVVIERVSCQSEHHITSPYGRPTLRLSFVLGVATHAEQH